jgi:hypothetical protein
MLDYCYTLIERFYLGDLMKVLTIKYAPSVTNKS